MKPLKLELQAFGPFVERQEVDFEKLSRNGIFLIKGETGSGKTTIFDAMTFALYGGGSGESAKVKTGRNDLEAWRCTQAPWSTETFVALTFSTHGRKYLFKRGLVPKRTSLSALHEAGEIDENGNLIPFFENTKADNMTQKAEELVGLTKEQFRQVVLLPQGQFERFLTASSSEKQDILQKIFGTERWGSYAEVFYNNAKTRKDALDNENREVLLSLGEEELTDVEALAEKIERMKAEQIEIARLHQDFEGETKKKALDDDRLLAKDYQDLHEQEDLVSKLDGEKEEIEALRDAYEKAEKAEPLRALISVFEKADEELTLRKNAVSDLKGELPEKEKAANDAAETAETHAAQSPVADLTKTIGEYESKRRSYQEYGGLKEAFSNAEGEQRKANTADKQAQTALETAGRMAAEAKLAFDKADADARQKRDRYFSGIYGEIAAELKEGEPCPVCGSTTHPKPAEKAADSVSKEEMESAQKTADEKRVLWTEAEDQRIKAEKDKNAAFERLKQAEACMQTALANKTAAEKNLIEGIADETALQAAIDALKEQIEAYNEKTGQLKRLSDRAAEELNALNTNILTAKGEQETAAGNRLAAKDALEDAMREKGYPDLASVKNALISAEKRSAMHEWIVSYDTSCREAAEELGKRKEAVSGKAEPDATLFEKRQKEIDEEISAYTQKDTKLKTGIDRLEKKRRTLETKQRNYKENIRQAESDLALARKLRGDTGVGLQRYVLAVMFNQVIGEANRMLQYVHGGRYHLFRSDERGAGNKRGLELKVHDNRSPEKEGRSVSMLSGGEKFLVSLALSIGMSAVAQRSGVQIEALFIDEGFGTLDNSSINDAMTVLESVRPNSGMIGIISHVEVLEATLQTQLNVIKRETGSVIAEA